MCQRMSNMFGQKKLKNGFNKIKAILISEPVLIAPNFQKQLKLAIDASDIGVVEFLCKLME